MLKLQKIVLFLLSACLLFSSFSVFAAAETVITPENDGGTLIEAETVIVTKPTFTVSVSSGIALGSLQKSETDSLKTAPITVAVSNVSDLGGKQVHVTVGTPDGTFHLYNETGAILPYQLYNQASGGTALEMNATYHIFTENESVTGRVQVNEKDITAAGSYSGVLTFRFTIEEQPSA